MRWEKVISHIFSAPLFSLYLLPTIFLREKSIGFADIFLAIIYLSVLPIALLLADFFRGKTDLFVSRREARKKYFAWATLAYGIGTIHFKILKHTYIFIFLACYTTVTLSMMILTNYMKVSVHVSGTAGPITYMVLVIDPIWVLAYTIIPLVSYARIRERAHNVKEIILAAITSILVTIITIKAILYIL